MIKKKVVIITVIVVLLFGSLNAVWFGYRNSLEKYVKNIPNDGTGVYVTNDEAENSFSFKFPNYLRFTSNMALIDKNNNALIIWTPFMREKSYGVRLLLDHQEVYELILDKNGNLIPEKNLNGASEIYQEKKDIITNLYNDAKSFWKDDF